MLYPRSVEARIGKVHHRLATAAVVTTYCLRRCWINRVYTWTLRLWCICSAWEPSPFHLATHIAAGSLNSSGNTVNCNRPWGWGSSQLRCSSWYFGLFSWGVTCHGCTKSSKGGSWAQMVVSNSWAPSLNYWLELRRVSIDITIHFIVPGIIIQIVSTKSFTLAMLCISKLGTILSSSSNHIFSPCLTHWRAHCQRAWYRWTECLKGYFLGMLLCCERSCAPNPRSRFSQVCAVHRFSLHHLPIDRYVSSPSVTIGAVVSRLCRGQAQDSWLNRISSFISRNIWRTTRSQSRRGVTWTSSSTCTISIFLTWNIMTVASSWAKTRDMMWDLIKLFKGTKRLTHNMLEARIYCMNSTCRMLRLLLINCWDKLSATPLKAITSLYL